MNPFSLPGPEFLPFWILLGLVAALATQMLRRVTAGPGASVPEIRRMADQLHPSEVAYLAVNIERAVEAVVAGLLHVELLRVVDGKLHRVERARDPNHLPEDPYRGIPEPSERSVIEAYVLDEVGRHRGVTVEALARGARHLAAQLDSRMTRDGLFARPSRLARISLYVPGALWLAMGAIKLGIGLMLGRPIAFLVVLLVGGMFVLSKVRPARLSTRGAAVLRSLGIRTHGLITTARRAPAQLSRLDLSLAYALVGTIAFPAWAAVMPGQAEAEVAIKGGASCGATTCGSCSG
ncbi:MAG: TIGR04222 domain-containing membrane protein, partial [Myxococcales bacterium]|nr:TIGR04222 domain-containing membrane protein [Myxococcales bacterium]